MQNSTQLEPSFAFQKVLNKALENYRLDLDLTDLIDNLQTEVQSLLVYKYSMHSHTSLIFRTGH